MQIAKSIPLQSAPPDCNGHIVRGLDAATICASWLKSHGFEVTHINISAFHSMPMILIVHCSDCDGLGGEAVQDEPGLMRAEMKWCFVEWFDRRH